MLTSQEIAKNKAADFVDSFGTEMVEVAVRRQGDGGHGGHVFKVHKTVLCDKVPYFKNVFCTGAIEEKARTTIIGFGPKSFDAFLQWVYGNKLPPLELLGGAPRDSFSLTMVLYRLGHRLGLPVFQDLVLDAFRRDHQIFGNFPEFGTIAKKYNESVLSDAYMGVYLVKLAIYQFFLDGENTSRQHEAMKRHTVFAVEFLKELKKLKADLPTDPRTLPDCDFHRHGKDEKCPQDKSLANGQTECLKRKRDE